MTANGLWSEAAFRRFSVSRVTGTRNDRPLLLPRWVEDEIERELQANPSFFGEVALIYQHGSLVRVSVTRTIQPPLTMKGTNE